MLAQREEISPRSQPRTEPGRKGMDDGKPGTPAYGLAANEAHATDDIKAPVGEAVADVSPFSPLELLVIAIGERDPLTVSAGGWWARLRRTLFGIEAPRPFADRRLETLRELAIALRRRRSPDSALEAALAAGITLRQIEHLRSRRSDVEADGGQNLAHGKHAGLSLERSEMMNFPGVSEIPVRSPEPEHALSRE
jgi:hypothetical protein